jgi:hypothetical protein
MCLCWLSTRAQHKSFAMEGKSEHQSLSEVLINELIHQAPHSGRYARILAIFLGSVELLVGGASLRHSTES